MNRQDVIKIKAELGVALGKRKDDYWGALKDFLSGTIKRAEFEFLVSQYLSKSNISLHNQFIKTLFFNSQALVSFPQQYEMKQIRVASKNDIKLREKIFELFSQEEIEKLKRKRSKKENNFLYSKKDVINFPNLGEERGELPDIKTLNVLIQTIVKDQGLQKTEDSCVYILQSALSTYIKNIISRASSLSISSESLSLEDLKFSLRIDRNLVIPGISVRNIL